MVSATQFVFSALGVARAMAGGCSPVTQLVFSNRCGKDIYLDGWGVTIVAGQTFATTSGRPSSQRIQWKFTDGQQYDFIELNSDWSGPGSCISGHPSYSNYNGFSMASKYEALNPDNGQLACADPGAAIVCHPWDGPCGAGGGYLCQGSNDCASAYSNWMRDSCARVVNGDGTFTPTFKDTTYGVNHGDFWCDEVHGFSELVGTMIGCVEHSTKIMLVITTCDVHPTLSTNTTDLSV